MLNEFLIFKTFNLTLTSVFYGTMLFVYQSTAFDYEYRPLVQYQNKLLKSKILQQNCLKTENLICNPHPSTSYYFRDY